MGGAPWVWGAGGVSPFPDWRRCKMLRGCQYNGYLSPQCGNGCGKQGRFYVMLRLCSVSPGACSNGISLQVGKEIFKVDI